VTVLAVAAVLLVHRRHLLGGRCVVGAGALLVPPPLAAAGPFTPGVLGAGGCGAAAALPATVRRRPSPPLFMSCIAMSSGCVALPPPFSGDAMAAATNYDARASIRSSQLSLCTPLTIVW